jgi:hypothetical protein
VVVDIVDIVKNFPDAVNHLAAPVAGTRSANAHSVL